MAYPRKTDGEKKEAPKAVSKPETPPKTKLRLKQNDFVGAKYAPKGTVVEFTAEEAAKRLQTEDKWEHAS